MAAIINRTLKRASGRVPSTSGAKSRRSMRDLGDGVSRSDWLEYYPFPNPQISFPCSFKGRTSTSHALFTLRSTVEYSDVFTAFLDCTKAFDRISQYGLFRKLMKRNIPLCILLIIICWHVGMTCTVKWGSEFIRF